MATRRHRRHRRTARRSRRHRRSRKTLENVGNKDFAQLLPKVGSQVIHTGAKTLPKMQHSFFRFFTK